MAHSWLVSPATQPDWPALAPTVVRPRPSTHRPLATSRIWTYVPPPPPLPIPHAYCSRSSPEAFTSFSAIDAPVPVLLVRLYQSPSRSPGQYTLPTPSVRSSLLTRRT